MAVQKRGAVLYVDDDSDLLAGVRRQQRGRFELVTEEDPLRALETLRAERRFAVIVSDLRMPGMDGFELLSQAAQIQPDATRVLLTGNADLETAKRAVNEGHVFRFLTKPCDSNELGAALSAGIEFYDLRIAQRELLERTLHGAVRVLADVLGLVNPAAFGRASRVTRYVKGLVHELDLPDAWCYEVAAMLSQIGCVTVPEALIEKVGAVHTLNLDERKILDDHPRVAQKLLSEIPRLEGVAEMIRYQNERYRSEASGDKRAGKDLPLGSRILKVALDLDRLEKREGSRAAALEQLHERHEWYDPDVLEVLEQALGAQIDEVQAIEIDQLEPGMIVSEDIRTANGLLLVSAGQCVSVGMVERLHNWARRADGSVPQTVSIQATRAAGDA